MTKFYLTGLLLLLLAGFLHFPNNSTDNDGVVIQRNSSGTVLPLGEQIRIARLEKKISQKDLADQVGLAKMNIEKIEKGFAIPQKDAIQKMEKVLNVQLKLDSY